MPDEVVAPAGGAAAAPTAEEVAGLRAQVAALSGEKADLTRAAQFWEGKAKAPAPAAAAPKDAVDEEEADLLELIATKGSKGLDALLKKRGFVSAADVSVMVNSKANELQAEEKLLKDFPELADKNSEFFKSTAQKFGELKEAGMSPGRAMVTAAKETALEFLQAGKMKTPAKLARDKADKREADRLARVNAQSGDRGGRTTADDEADTEITPEQRRIAIKMLGGNGVTDEQAVEKYMARAKIGVNMSKGR